MRVTIRLPSHVLIVHGYGVFDSKAIHGVRYIFGNLLKIELGGTNIDQNESIPSIVNVKLPDVRRRPNAIYAIEGPGV